MDDVADVDDGFLEDAVGGRVGDHERREVGGVVVGLGGEVGDVDVAIAVTFDGDDFHAGT